MNSRSILLLGFLSISLFATAQRKVLIIGIDGCRGDAIIAANAPRLDSLRNSGYRTLEGNTHAPTWSGTGWSSMLTGVWETKHGVTNNSFTGSQFGTWPHFFAHLRSARPELDLRSYAHWSPVITQIATAADQELNFGTDQAVADAAVNMLRNGDLDVLFLHFDDVDHAGHAYGFQTNIPNYLAAIEVVDERLGPIMAALADRSAGEEWLVYVTTDHGGTPAGHGVNALDQQRIFAFASAPDIELPLVSRRRTPCSCLLPCSSPLVGTPNYPILRTIGGVVATNTQPEQLP